MLFVVCFNCIRVLTPEEVHNCLPSNDDKYDNDWLLINYEPVCFTKSSRETNISGKGGDFNLLPSNRSANLNDYFDYLDPTINANSSAEFSSLTTRNRQSKPETSAEFLNLFGQNRFLSEQNPYFQLERFLNTHFNRYQENENVIRTPNSNPFLSSRKLYTGLNEYLAVKENLSSASQAARGFNSGDLKKNTWNTSPIIHNIKSDVLHMNMQKSTLEKGNISSTPLYNKRSKPSTSDYIPKIPDRTNSVLRQ